MSLRDEIEAVIRSWNAYELGRGAAAVVDYDLVPPEGEPTPAPNRIAVLEQLTDLRQGAVEEDKPELVRRLDADLTYLGALLGERKPLDEYVRLTQGCPAIGWPTAHLDAVRTAAIEALDRVGVTWGPKLIDDLEEVEGRLAPEDAPDAIRGAAAELEDAVRAITGTTATYDLNIVGVEEQAYWSYWLDGAGRSARLRLNLRNARYTKVQVRQFALHEILGHALQFASLAKTCENEDVPWVRLMSVHAGYQVLFEGLAQALPLFVTPDDDQLVARVRLAHYGELVNAAMHVAINAGKPASSCVGLAKQLMPHWTEARIASVLNDRSVDPLLRSYHWSYPAGIDWFVALSAASSHEYSEVLRRTYQVPMTPSQLSSAWTGGPAFGGTSQSSTDA